MTETMTARLTAGKQDGAPQRRKRRANDFSPTKRQKFFDALALTCNVLQAARHAGISPTTAYKHRHLDADFAERWRRALATGYDRLEALVLEHGGAGVPLEPADPDRAVAEGTAVVAFDFDRAIKILQFHRADRAGRAVRRGGRRMRATREETNAALMQALTAAKRRIEKLRDLAE